MPTCADSICGISTWKAARSTAHTLVAPTFLQTSRRRKLPTACNTERGCESACSQVGWEPPTIRTSGWWDGWFAGGQSALSLMRQVRLNVTYADGVNLARS